jgi:uncharacterized tellurite resistance protein B-like protein
MLRDWTRDEVRDLALIYLALGQHIRTGADGTGAVTIADRLQTRCWNFDRPMVDAIVAEATTQVLSAGDPIELAAQAILRLRHSLRIEERSAVVEDLFEAARSDGRIEDTERGILAGIGECWGVVLPDDAMERDRAVPEVDHLEHLAFLYLVVAHGTDDELSPREAQVMRRRLQEWQSGLTGEQVNAVMLAATKRYARGVDEAALTVSVDAIKNALPASQRTAALQDLIQIANADGYFLDGEEDLLNHLLSAWDIDPSAGYTSQGVKE